MNPGDELEVVCIFNSKKMTKPVYYGDATSDEMCYSFLTYYPKLPFNHCIQHGKGKGKGKGKGIENCNEFVLSSAAGCQIESARFKKTLDDIWDYCDRTGGNNCKLACKNLLTNKSNPCVGDDARRYIEYYLGKPEPDVPMLNALRSCDAELPYLERMQFLEKSQM